MTSIYSRHFLDGRATTTRLRTAVLGLAARLEAWSGREKVWNWGLRVVAASLVRDSFRFAAREVRGVPGVRAYRLRDGGRVVCVRHRTSDSFVLADIFARGEYRPPPVLASRWATSGGGVGTVLDLGGHVGVLPLYMLTTYPGPRSRVVSFEPDRANADVLEECIRRNGLGSRWSLVRACAGVAAGSTRFFTDEGWASRVPEPGEEGPTVETAVEDVFEAVGAGVDLMKLDIEGGEWDILSDPRMATSPIGAVVLEYHPMLCPDGPPRDRAVRALAAAGFRTIEVLGEADKGCVWAMR